MIVGTYSSTPKVSCYSVEYDSFSWLFHELVQFSIVFPLGNTSDISYSKMVSSCMRFDLCSVVTLVPMLLCVFLSQNFQMQWKQKI